MKTLNTTSMTNNVILLSVGIVGLLLLCSSASADIAQIKVYKEAFPDAKPKCISCHVSDKPKKDGDHELNAYGTKVKGLDEKPTADTYKKAGSIEDNENNK